MKPKPKLKKSRVQPIRWTLAGAASEFKMHPDTLSKRVKAGGIEPGKDGRFSTLDMARAIYGDMDGEKLRDKRLDADLKEIEKAVKLREWMPCELVERVWGNVIDDLRIKISCLQIDDQAKAEIIADLQKIPTDDYFTTANKVVESDLGSVAGEA